MSKRKDLQEELKIVERSLKRTTSLTCEYEINEDVAKKFLKMREGSSIPTRIALQAGIETKRDQFFEDGCDAGTIRERVFQHPDPRQRLFNTAMFTIFSKKTPGVTLERIAGKLDKSRARINKSFQEISFREEFYFEKITKQVIAPYKKTMDPHEFETLKLIHDFQDKMRLFNWNIVDKDPQVEFLFEIFQLLRVKQAMLDVSFKERLGAIITDHARSLDGETADPVIMDLLHVAMRLESAGAWFRRAEHEIFTGAGSMFFTVGRHLNGLRTLLGGGDKIASGERFIRGYVRHLRIVNKMIVRYEQARNRAMQGKVPGSTGNATSALIELIDAIVDPVVVEGSEKHVQETYQNEFKLVQLFTRMFGKIFTMLKKKRTMSDGAIMKRLFSEVAFKERKRVLVVLGMIGCNAIIGMLVPLLFKNLVDFGFGDQNFSPDINYIYNTGILFLVLSTIMVSFSIVANYLIQYLANKTMFRMREQMFDKLQKLSLDYFNAQPAGKIISYITNDVETIQQVISQGLLTVFIQVFQVVGSVFLMFYISWQLALVSFSIIPFLLIMGAFIFGKARKYFVITRVKIANVTTHTQESIAGMRVIQAFAIEDKDHASFKRATNEELEINLKAAKLFASLPGLIMGVLSAGIAVLLMTGGHLYIQNLLGLSTTGFTRGSLFSFIMYLIQFFGPLVQLMMFVSSIQNSMAAGERIIKLVDEMPSVEERAHSIGTSSPEFKNLSKETITLAFDNVNFEYEKGIPVLKDVSLQARPRERLAIVGYTGAGKTTFISLLARFWDPTSGRILINGIDIRHFKLDALRQLMGIVLQDTFLFSGTVMDNIKYGRPGAADEEVHEITRKLGIHEFILQMENGYETPVRERGSRLSVGQKQMIAFARALLIDPPILILDEATSAIDPYSEIIVKNALDVLLQGRTSITIAHRLSTVINSDRIIVIDSGRIVEQGTHEALAQKDGGLYRHLYELQ